MLACKRVHEVRSGRHACAGCAGASHVGSASLTFLLAVHAESEDDGYILAYGYDASADRSDFLVFDASCLSKGPLTVFPLRHMLAAGIHGCWDSSYHGP